MAGPTLNLKLQQKLVMTPSLKEAITLLQMPTADLQTYIQNELLENPFLKAEDGTSEQDKQETTSQPEDAYSQLEDGNFESAAEQSDFSWENMYDSGEAPASKAPLGDEVLALETAAPEKTLHQHLRQQLGMATKEAGLLFVGAYLIDAIDDAGYLRLDLQETARQLKTPFSKIQEALALVQTFEPAGVAAANLADCLGLQLAQRQELTETAEIILQNLPLLAQRDFKKLARLAKCDVEDVLVTCAQIVGLNPKPGLEYGAEMASTVVPDVVVFHKKGAWVAELNTAAMPTLLMQGGALNMLKTARGEDKTYMKDRMGRAQWLIKSLAQRAQTIHKVSNEIVATQAGFFEYGLESLNPLTLKEVADKIGMHESTISRVTNGKYMQTPMGTFELKYFFSAAINTTGGQVSVAAESVKAMIKRLIEAEDPRKPLSDEKLVKMLKEEGIDVARRTVAKYREAQGIGSSSDRRIR